MFKVDAVGRENGLAEIERSGVRVGNLLWLNAFTLREPDRWAAQREALQDVLNVARNLAADCVYITTGPPDGLLADAAAEAFARAVEPVLDYSRAIGVPLAVEHNHASRRDIGFIYTLREMIEYALEIDVKVCVELQNCWVERHLERLIRDGVDSFALVQVSDWVLGDEVPDRAVPGDGIVPLTTIIEWLLDAGYRGAFDIEMRGPRIDAEGLERAVLRAAEWLSGTLDRLGA
jgi:sugar phosphate isomerase/epimerase